ncbi:MAG: PilZ domain-containing protein [Gammaproteobacteria bacterium]|nr:MAG: PilZ domain-containing protein [Gammaproteobacteria bacterium]
MSDSAPFDPSRRQPPVEPAPEASPGPSPGPSRGPSGPAWEGPAGGAGERRRHERRGLRGSPEEEVRFALQPAEPAPPAAGAAGGLPPRALPPEALPPEGLPLQRVHDVSVSGCGVESPVPLAPGQALRLVLRTADLDLALRARVMWCEAAGEGRHRAGLRFEAPDPHHCVLMFMALRRWLDDFV